MKFFSLKMITPEKTLFEGKARSLKISVHDGMVEILANHISSMLHIYPAECKIELDNGEIKSFVTEDGIVDIEKNEVLLTSIFLEWSEDLKEALETKHKRILAEKERRKESDIQHKLVSLELMRTIASHKDKKGP